MTGGIVLSVTALTTIIARLRLAMLVARLRLVANIARLGLSRRRAWRRLWRGTTSIAP